jgi:hypothetical protein
MPVDLRTRAIELTKEKFPTTKSLKALVREGKVSGLRKDSFVSCLIALAQIILPENHEDWPSSEEKRVWSVEELAMRVQSRSNTPIELNRWLNEAETALRAFREFSRGNWTTEGFPSHGAPNSDTRHIETLLKKRMELLQQCVDPFYCDSPQTVDSKAKSRLKRLSNNMFKVLVTGRNPSTKKIVFQKPHCRGSDNE